MSQKQDIRIVRLAEGDAKFASDHLANFSSMVLNCEGMYPGIDKWVKNKVIPGIRSKERAAFVGYLGDKPVVTAVAKKGEDAKICHLNIAPSLQNTNLGEVFFTLMGIEMKPYASRVHFTLPETLWEQKHSFFESFGFEGVASAAVQYRLFDQELRSQAEFADVWRAILEKMPKLASIYTLGGFGLDSQLLLSIQPKYSQAILNGSKTVEVRRRFSHKWANCRINIYESSPTMGLVGEATITEVDEDRTETIWNKYGGSMGCSKSEFDGYAEGCSKMYAVSLANVHAYRAPVPLAWAELLLGADLQAPQSYLTLENNRPWSQAISVAAYMEACFQGKSKLGDITSPRRKPAIVSSKGNRVPLAEQQLMLI